ncbi:hypothetical protein B0T14DRAFT_552544 [Immersiella caudata]|uniref:Uncharacterized protein n=1 Tax=Immersiella caudata TaxID=314043 RepID=A0AA39X5F7_9PEZI|nr:hypothetical protein B0T14DRAFT_552544 [Immersiella caudata]
MEAPEQEAGRGPPLDDDGNSIYLEEQNKLGDLGIFKIGAQIVVVSQEPTEKAHFLRNLSGIPARFFKATNKIMFQVIFRRAPLDQFAISIVPGKEADAAQRDSFEFVDHVVVGSDRNRLESVLLKAKLIAVLILAASFHAGTHRQRPDCDVLQLEVSAPRALPTHSAIATDIDLWGRSLPVSQGRSKPMHAQQQRHFTNCFCSILAPLHVDADQEHIKNTVRLAKMHGPNLERTPFVPASLDPCREDEGHAVDFILLEEANLRLGFSSNAPPAPWWNNGIGDAVSNLDALRQDQELALEKSQEDIVHNALENRDPHQSYDLEESLDLEPTLAQKIFDMNKGFSLLMWNKGHNRDFSTALGSVNASIGADYETLVEEICSDEIDIMKLMSIHRIGRFEREDPSSIKQTIDKYYRARRGHELGNLSSPPVMPALFQARTSGWRAIVAAHIAAVAAVIHSFIKDTLERVFQDRVPRENFLQKSLMDKLEKLYQDSLRVAYDILSDERNERPSTHNHGYAESMRSIQTARDAAVQS